MIPIESWLSARLRICRPGGYASTSLDGMRIRGRGAQSNPYHGVSKNPERSRSRKPENIEVNTFLGIAKKRGEGNYRTALIGLMVGINGRQRAEILHLEELRRSRELESA